MPKSKRRSRKAEGFKLVPKPAARPILAALRIKSVRVVGNKWIIEFKARGAAGSRSTIIRPRLIPMGRACVVFSSQGCKGHPLFKKVTIPS